MSREDTFTSMLTEFRGPEMGFFNRARKSGFPTPLDNTVSYDGSKSTPKRPFDDTVLNINDSIIRKKMRKSLDDSIISSECEQDGLCDTPWEIKHLSSELSQARAEIKALETNISQLHGVRREAEVLFENEKASLKASLDRERCTVKELERRIKIMKRREEKLHGQLQTAMSKVNTDRQDYEQKAVEIQEENMNLKEEIQNLDKDKKENELKLKVAKMTSEKLENELQIVKEQLESMEKQMTEMRNCIKDFEINKAALTNAEHRIKELESEIISQSETAAVIKIQQSKLSKYGELERQLKSLTQQNNKLRESTTNSFYLESVVEELKIKLEKMDECEKKLVQSNVKLSTLEGQLNEFKRLSKDVSGAGSSADELSSYIRHLQANSLVNSSQISQLKSKVKSLEEMAQESNNKIESQKTELADLKKELDTCNLNLKRLRKQNALITWERNDLRSLIDSCQKEVTIGSLHDPRVEALEKLVSSYRNKLQQIESSPNILSLPGPSSEVKIDMAEFEKLKTENQSLKEKVDKFEYEIAHRALKGDFSNMNTKILHFKNNPLSEAVSKQESEIDVLRKENIELKERLRLMKEGESNITQNLAGIIDTDISKTLQETKEKVKSLEMQNQRLKEAFKKSMHDFREAIFSIFGYQIDGLPNKIFRVTSLYAESQEHHLLFKKSNSGEMEMLETEFSKTLSELIDLILIQHNSIPVFLASLTIDLFKRQTNCVLDSVVQH
ncbi:mitotic spindle assembly checkpoint protein MAD1 [Cimex lectularius]|uniref:Mitotic spindle assembly checkpoint protein MAD1 n=1 Tax=Cimex lectularius TaxID=79782 RepID=A0A8I6RC69_CIMLE|nr:mitotic spindle assembly checkpoint protein MAD1 [Cimex lectularius]